VILKRIAKLEAEIETYQQSSPSKKDKEKEEFDKRASRFVDTDLRYIKITPPPKKK
jgi:hypothetical protein